MVNKKIKMLLRAEIKRQNTGIELIASENYPSKDVMKLCGSAFMWKYAEGYPHKRYYGGCEYVDAVEDLAISMACRVFDCNYANVQPHSGSQANAAAYRALLPDGGKILSIVLNDGGHLTHGSPVSFSSHLYDFAFYSLGSTGRINFDALYETVIREKPDVVLCGYSAYPYSIDFVAFRVIVDLAKVVLNKEIYLMADIAHIAGLIAGGVHPSPFPSCDLVTTTTHKTLRGPRGGMILTNDEELSKRVNSAIFPYYQGGPAENIIAAKAQMLLEASTPAFQEYVRGVVVNTKLLRDKLAAYDNVFPSDTENHLFLLNTLSSYGLTGLEAQKKLEEIGITTNKNMLPGDTLKPSQTSGIRIGMAAMTTRGITEVQIALLAKIIHGYLLGTMELSKAKKLVRSITRKLKKVK